MKTRDSFYKLYKDQSGSAMVMVLVAIAFIGILASILMFTAYAGYQMRLMDRQGKDSFYSAEKILDEINVGLQEKVSKALEAAYHKVMLNYGLLETAKKRNEELYKVYCEELKTSLSPPLGSVEEYDIEILRNFLSEESKGDGKNGVNANGSPEYFGTYGAILDSNANTGTYKMKLEDKGIILKDLKVTYVDKKGYVSIITTDIRLALPEVTFSQSSDFPDLNDYLFIAKEGLITQTASMGNIVLQGNLYAGCIQIGIPGIQDALVKGVTYFKPMEGGIESASGMVISKGAIEIGVKGELVTEKTELWAESIGVNASSVTLDGTTNVQNDLTLEGRGSQAKIKGEYFGFGTQENRAEKSSAILINGNESVLDLSLLDRFHVGGRAYIGSGNEKNKDVLMGESVAVKSNQLIYLIPPECLGWEVKDGILLESKYGRNPLTKDQYEEIFVKDKDKFLPINADVPVAKLGGKTLSEYIKKEKIVGSEIPQYVPEVVFQQTNGETLVYCYLRFKDEVAANQYFQDYFGVNSEEIQRYTKFYAKEISLKNPENMAYIHLAGNGLFLDDTDHLYIQNANDDYSDRVMALEQSAMKQEEFKALTAKLLPNMIGLSETEQGKEPFENIIEETVVEEYLLKFDLDGDGIVQINTLDGTKSTLVTNRKYVVDSNTPPEVSLIISLDEVKVVRNFQGLILTKDQIIVRNESGSELQVKALPIEELTKCLLAKETLNSKDYYVMDLFKDGKNYGFTGQQAVDSGTHKIDISELIIYEHWTKK